MISFLLGDELYYFNESPDVEARLDTDDVFAREFLSKHLGVDVIEFERVEIENAMDIVGSENNIVNTEEDTTNIIYVEDNSQEPQNGDNAKATSKWDDGSVKVFLKELSKYKHILRKGAAKTERVYFKLAKALHQSGYTKINITDCQNKMKNLLTTYRRNIARKKSGGTITWEYFEAMEEVFKIRARIYVPQENLIDTLDDEFVKCDNENSNNTIADLVEYVNDCFDDAVVDESASANFVETICEEGEETKFTESQENLETDYFNNQSQGASQQQKENEFMERFLKLSEERNEILKEILKVIKSKV